MKVTDRSLEAFRELATAGVTEPLPGADGDAEADYRFTGDGWARRQELLCESEERIERERFEPPNASNLSEAARELLRRRLAGDREVRDASRPLYRELVAARIMYPVSTWVGRPESVFRFTRAGWERREEWINACADALHPWSSGPVRAPHAGWATPSPEHVRSRIRGSHRLWPPHVRARCQNRFCPEQRRTGIPAPAVSSGTPAPAVLWWTDHVEELTR